MADEHAAEPLPGSPGQRALGAMESAVRRARESSGVAPLPPPPRSRGQAFTRPADPAVSLPTTQPGAPAGGPTPAGPSRWLIRSVAAVGALVAAAAIALLVSLIASPASSPPPSATRSAPTTAAPARQPSTARTGGGSRTPATAPNPSSTTTPTSPSTSTPTTAAVAPNGPPVIASLSPSSGSAGQSVTIAGSNFLSTSGQIVATFNGQVAPTSCPAQSTCTVTVPPSTSPSAQVVITTAGGASNAVTFSYN
jgi:hypothetical protein